MRIDRLFGKERAPSPHKIFHLQIVRFNPHNSHQMLLLASSPTTYGVGAIIISDHSSIILRPPIIHPSQEEWKAENTSLEPGGGMDDIVRKAKGIGWVWANGVSTDLRTALFRTDIDPDSFEASHTNLDGSSLGRKMTRRGAADYEVLKETGLWFPVHDLYTRWMASGSGGN